MRLSERTSVNAASRWNALDADVTACRRCPRLVEHRETMARVKRAAFADETYWGKPVPGLGDRRARLLIVGLAPAAHGANRTGRMFTGDRSGDWLFRALHEAGFANQSASNSVGDGLELTDCFITAAARCAPPANKPTPGERDNCRPFLERELDLLGGDDRLRVIVVLGQFAYDHTLRVLRDRRFRAPVPKPKFGHGRHVSVIRDDPIAAAGPSSLTLITSYHPSQQNTFTGKLTRPMLADVFAAARRELG